MYILLHGDIALMGTVFLACGLLGYIIYKSGRRKDKMITVPMATFDVFSVIKGMTSSQPHEYLLQLARASKRTVFRLPLPIFQITPIPKLRRVFVVSDVQLARRILQDSASDKPPEIYSSFENITNRPVMFTSRNSAYTKSIRKIAHVAFSQKKQMHLIIKKHVDQWLDGRLRKFSISGKSFDPVDEALAVTFYIICEAAFGYEASYDEFRLFTDNLDMALTEFAYRQSTNPLRKLFWFLLPGVWKARRAAKLVMEFAERMRRSYNTSGNDSFMDSLRNNEDLHAKQQTSEILMFMAAGHETTGSMISNIMIQFSKHQQVQIKLRQSLLETKNGEKIEDNAYFKNILLEANRIFPVAPMGSTRETRRDFALNDGTQIPAHSICFLPQYLSYRDTTVFENEDVFDPDRWNQSTKDMIDTASLAFSLGPRNCPGKPLAIQEMNYLLPRLLLKYSLHQEREGQAEYRVIMKHTKSLLKAKKVGSAIASNESSEEEVVESKDATSLHQPNAFGVNYIVRRMILLLAAILVVGMTLATQTAATTETCVTSAQHDFKIAVLTEPSPIGSYICGQSKRIEYLMNYLVTNGNDTVELITAEIDSASKPSSWQGVGIHYTFGFGLPSYNQISISFDFTGKALRELYRFSPDVIHATTPGPLLFPSVIASRLFNVPIVMSCHTHLTAYAAAYLPPIINKIAEWFLWRFTEVVHSFADLTLVTSPQIQEEFVRNRIATSLWQKGVNSTQFHPHHYNVNMRSRMTGDHPEEFLITYIGRLAEEKRLTLLKDVIQNINGAILCFVGTGPHEGKLKRHFEGTNTIFLGQLTGVELSQAFASADMFVMPSTSETLGFVVLESMASRVPVVAANAGGLKHLIQNATTGFLVPPDKAEEFTRRVQELKANTTLRDHIADAARRESELWSWESSMKALRFDLYPRAIQNCEERLEKKAWRLLKQLLSWQ